jgi:predicted PolB exonuclease-like 3'-5' exonuclease
VITFGLDIETIPTQNPEVRQSFQNEINRTLLDLTPPDSYTGKKRADWIEKKEKELNVPLDQYEPYRKLSFDGCSNHIISIGVYVNGEEKHFTVQNGDAIEGEKEVMNGFFTFIREFPRSNPHDVFKFVGHNIVGFDLKIIKQRSMILGILPPAVLPFDTKPWDKNPYDTMVQWDGKNYVSMDKLAKAFGLTGKGEVDGSMVYDMFLDGKFAEIGEYCADDAHKAFEIYQRMTFNNANLGE